ncbi:MAG TPA: DUF1992 domain-containing protein [Streptosporangiaceae bacterium]|nr:DUF1992 domain-containing protein [Streptosporangiaceae bacterium]
MTERKPAGVSFSSWIDQQISEAAERGAFDDLPGAGKPLPRRDDFSGDAWIADWVRRSGGSPADCLPAPLRLRRESERLAETVHELRSEQEVRDSVAALNEQILAHRRIPADPPVFVPRVDEEAMIARWRAARQPPAPPAQAPPAQAPPTPPGGPLPGGGAPLLFLRRVWARASSRSGPS